MVMIQVNPLDAVVTFLRAQPSIIAMVGTRVFHVGLPDSENAQMPRAAVVVTGSGSTRVIGSGGYVEMGNRRYDVRSFGATHAEASVLDIAVYLALKQMKPQKVNGMMLYAAIPETTALNMEEPVTKWPLAFSTYVLTVSEHPVPA